MGRTKTVEERIEAFVTRVDQSLRGRESGKGSARSTIRKRLKTVLGECGYERRSRSNVTIIDDALRQKGIFTHPPMVDRRLPLEEWIMFDRRADVEARFSLFKKEADFQEFLVKNFDLIEEFRNLRLVRPQYVLPSGRAVDLYCQDMRTQDAVLIEIKHGKPGDGMLTQIMSYMDHFRSRAGGNGVRGIVVTATADETIKAALASVSADYPITWMCYRADFALEEIDLSG